MPSTSIRWASASRHSRLRAGTSILFGAKHGFDSAEGMHAGDMPNIHVPDSGVLEIEVLNTLLKLDATLFDADGAAIVIHDGPDDYASDPAGAAGSRIACGVIVR